METILKYLPEKETDFSICIIYLSNLNLRLFASVKIVFNLINSGHIVPRYQFHFREMFLFHLFRVL